MYFNGKRLSGGIAVLPVDPSNVIEPVLEICDERYANRIVAVAQGDAVAQTDTAEEPLQGLTVFGKTKQNGTPTPNMPIPLESIGTGEAAIAVTATITGKNLLKLTDRVVSTDTVSSNKTKRTLDGNQIFVGISADNWLNPYNILSYTVRETSVTVMSKQGAYGIGFDVEVTPGNTYAFSVAEKSYEIRCAFYQADGTLINYTNAVYGSVVRTAPSDAKWAMVIVVPNIELLNTEITYTDLQLEIGTVATDYEPYKQAQTLTVSTPNGLAGIPVTSGGNYTDEKGQQWVCDEVDLIRGVYVQRLGLIESYDGQAVTTPYMSTTGALTTGASVLYVLASPIETSNYMNIERPADPHTYYPHTTITAEGAGIAVTYVADTKNYIDNKFTELQNAILASGANI